ncbi:MAG: hypothetical protein P8X58_01760 [Syntrophobacterales bacterium]
MEPQGKDIGNNQEALETPGRVILFFGLGLVVLQVLLAWVSHYLAREVEPGLLILLPAALGVTAARRSRRIQHRQKSPCPVYLPG